MGTNEKSFFKKVGIVGDQMVMNFTKNPVHWYLIVIIRLNESFNHKTNFYSLSKRNNDAESYFLFCKFI